MHKNAAFLIMTALFSLSLCALNIDAHEQGCSEDIAGCIGCTTPCLSESNDPFMIKASSACTCFTATTSLTGCTAMLLGGCCFLPCLHISEQVAYGFVGSGAVMEAPALCATCATALYATALGLEKREFIQRVDEARQGTGNDRWSLKSWWSCAIAPLRNCCQLLANPCCGASQNEETWKLHDDSSGGAQVTSHQ